MVAAGDGRQLMRTPQVVQHGVQSRQIAQRIPGAGDKQQPMSILIFSATVRM
jgi:hypothetical protein